MSYIPFIKKTFCRTEHKGEKAVVLTRGRLADGRPKTRGEGRCLSISDTDNPFKFFHPSENYLETQQSDDFNLSQSYCGVTGYTGIQFPTQGNDLHTSPSGLFFESY